MNRIQKTAVGIILMFTLLLISSAMTPWVPQLQLALGATPSVQNVPNVTTTSASVYVQAGWNRLTCSSDVYYLLVADSTTAVTSSTGTLVRGPQGSNGLPKPAWLLVSSSPYLALLLRSGTVAQCNVEFVSLDGAASSVTTLAVSSTLTVTGAVVGLSTAQFDGITKLGTTDAGALIANGTFNATGAVVHGSTVLNTGAVTNLSSIQVDGAAKFGLTDAGSLAVNGTLNVAGDNINTGTKTHGSCTLNNGSPSTCTATVNTGAICVCSTQTTSTTDVKCVVSSTTLTVTGPNTNTDVISYICMQGP